MPLQEIHDDSDKLSATLRPTARGDFVKLVKEQLVPLFKKQLADVRAIGFPKPTKSSSTGWSPMRKSSRRDRRRPIKFVNRETDPLEDITAPRGIRNDGVRESTTDTTAASPSTT